MNEDFEKKIENSDNGMEANDGNENAENLEGGEEKDKQVLEDKAGANEKEEKTAAEQAEGDYGKEEAFGEQGKATEGNGDGSDVNACKTCSANYEPPNYVPNFTVWEEPRQEIPSKKQKKTISMGIVIGICAITLALSVFLGTLAGAIAGGRFSLGFGDDGKQIVNIITSPRDIVVEELEGDIDYDNLTVAQVAGLVGESVVEITTAQKQSYGSYIQSGAGSGVIFAQAGTTGYIVTNYHVVGDALGQDGKIVIKIKNSQSGRGYEEYEAAYFAGDEREDIAVLTVTTLSDHVLSCADITDSSKLLVGEEVVAIGNPLGTLGGTVTNGIVSALDREIVVGDYPMTLLQTNAAINPGNSGGGLFDMKGKLIGIVNAKQSSSGIEGLGFAIPSNIVKKAFSDLLEYKYIRDRAALGIKIQQYSSMWGDTAVYVAESSADGTLQRNDRLLKVNGTEVNTMSDCYFALKNVVVGENVEVVIERGVSEITVNVKTIEYKPE